MKKKSVAEQLERCAGKRVELHYKEYLGALPWRGMSNYVVDSVYSVEETNPKLDDPTLLPPVNDLEIF